MTAMNEHPISRRRSGASLAAALILAAAALSFAAAGQARAQSDDPLGEEFLAAPAGDEGKVQEGRLSPDHIATITRLETYLNELSA